MLSIKNLGYGPESTSDLHQQITLTSAWHIHCSLAFCSSHNNQIFSILTPTVQEETYPMKGTQILSVDTGNLWR